MSRMPRSSSMTRMLARRYGTATPPFRAAVVIPLRVGASVPQHLRTIQVSVLLSRLWRGVGGACTCGLREEGVYRGRQRLDVEGLGNEDGARGQVARRGNGRAEDDGRAVAILAIAQLAGQLQAGEQGHHHVREHQVR